VGGKPASAPAMSKTDHAAVAVTHRQLGDLLRPGGVPHGGEQRADPERAAQRGGLGATVDEPGMHRLDHLVQRETPLQVLLRRVAHLGVHDAVRGEVQRALTRDPVQPLLGLHDRDGVHEGLQIALQRAGVGRRDEPVPQPGRVGLGQRVPGRVCQLDDRRRPQTTVQVVVQQCFGGPDDVLVGDGDHERTLGHVGSPRHERRRARLPTLPELRVDAGHPGCAGPAALRARAQLRHRQAGVRDSDRRPDPAYRRQHRDDRRPGAVPRGRPLRLHRRGAGRSGGPGRARTHRRPTDHSARTQ